MPSKPTSSKTGATAPKPRLSIRTRLIVLALLILVPLMLDRVRLLEATRAERIESAHAEVLDVAKRGVDTQLEVVNSTRAVLQVVARAYLAFAQNGPKSEAECNAFVAAFKPDVPWMLSLSVISSDDRIICSTRPTAIGLNVADRDYIRNARTSWNFVLSDYLVNRATREPNVIAAQPTMMFDERSNAIIISSIDLQWIGRLAGKISQRPRSIAFLLDGNGFVLAGLTGREDSIGRGQGDHPLVRTLLSNGGGTFTADGLDGIRRIYAVSRIPGTEARFVVGLDERDILSRIDREVGISYLQLVLFGLIVLFAAWFGGEQLIVEPIRALSRTAARIGRGDLDVRSGRQSLTSQRWAAEFAPLAAALEDMASRLAEREEDLRSTNVQLEELASLDALSGLPNRRSFNARLGAEWQHAAKMKRPVSLLMIDVDHFKLFNDNYGHLAGDNCLRNVGEKITAAAVGTDFAARFGGEEFALLMPDAMMQEALDLAERLRTDIERLSIVNEGATNGTVTVSIGVASLVPGAGDVADILIEAADAGLYAAKRRGRNTVVGHAAVELLKVG
jgi:diguanylate cyclase (GGDEF)-like protein